MFRTMAASMAMAAMVGTPAQAQQIGPYAPISSQMDARATVGITVPIGGRAGSIDRVPRIELRLGQGSGASVQPSRPVTLRAIGIRGSDDARPAPSMLAVTLGPDRRWIANGRVLRADEDETPEDDDGIDTLEGIGIGVGVLVAAAGIAFAALILPAFDCDADEEC